MATLSLRIDPEVKAAFLARSLALGVSQHKTLAGLLNRNANLCVSEAVRPETIPSEPESIRNLSHISQKP